MLRLNQNIPLGFFIDLKWASRGPVKAKSLLHGGARRAWFGAVLQPAQRGWHPAPAAVTGCLGRLPLRELQPAGKASRGGPALHLSHSARPGLQPPPGSHGLWGSSTQEKADLGLPGGARLFISEHAFGGDRAKASFPGSPGRLSWLPRVGPGVTEQLPRPRYCAAQPPPELESAREAAGRSRRFGGNLRVCAGPGSAPCGCLWRPGGRVRADQLLCPRGAGGTLRPGLNRKAATSSGNATR